MSSANWCESGSYLSVSCGSADGLLICCLFFVFLPFFYVWICVCESGPADRVALRRVQRGVEPVGGRRLSGYSPLRLGGQDRPPPPGATHASGPFHKPQRPLLSSLNFFFALIMYGSVREMENISRGPTPTFGDFVTLSSQRGRCRTSWLKGLR